MTEIMRNAEKLTLYHDPSRYTCQVGAAQLRNGDVVVVFNETSGYIHPDFDSILLIRSTDNGQSWDRSPRATVWPATHHFGSDTPSITQLSDGTLLVNYFQWAFVDQKGMLGRLWAARPAARYTRCRRCRHHHVGGQRIYLG